MSRGRRSFWYLVPGFQFSVLVLLLVLALVWSGVPTQSLIPKNGKDQKSFVQIEGIVGLPHRIGSDPMGWDGMGSLLLPPLFLLLLLLLYNAIVNKQSYARQAKSEHEEEQHQRAGQALWRMLRICRKRDHCHSRTDALNTLPSKISVA